MIAEGAYVIQSIAGKPQMVDVLETNTKGMYRVDYGVGVTKFLISSEVEKLLIDAEYLGKIFEY